MSIVDGRNYSSNNTKLLKHLDTLKALQDNKPKGPVMVHLSLTSNCNLNCDYCCYGGRTKGESLSLDQLKSTIDQFMSLGTKGIEFTGSGEPTLHPNINDIIKYAHDKGASIGLITNGTNPDKIKNYDLIDWIRVSSHVLNLDNPFLEDKFRKTIVLARNAGVDVGSVFIYTGDDEALGKAVRFFERQELPSRITPDLTRPVGWIQEEMPRVKGMLKNMYNAKFSFVTDFNIEYTRQNNNCFMKFVKPFVHTDGFVYACPGASFSPENFKNVDPKYRVCSIDDILKTYTSMTNKPDQYDCKFCKYQTQQDLITEIVKPTKHNDFA